jgi:hypothetical protein
VTVHRPAIVALVALVLPAVARAQVVGSQPHVHAQGHPAQQPAPGAPVQAGQAAFGAIQEIVGMLMADSATDWARVDIEALRRHLMDMNAVTLEARVSQTPVEDGALMEVTGEGSTVEAIRRMAHAHAAQLDESTPYRIGVQDIPAGVRLQVTARNPGDARTEAMIRGLGFVGILATGDHHQAHHLAIARGTAPHGHHR